MDEDVYDECNLFSTFESVENGDENVPLHSRLKSESTSLSELDSLKQENILLKKLLRKVGSNPSEDEPLANILFYSGPYSHERQGQFEDFICRIGTFSQNITRRKSNLSSEASLGKRNIMSDGFATALGRISDCTNLDYGELEYDMTDLPMGCVQYFTSFCLDRFGSDVEKIFPTPPSYERVYYKTLPEDTGSRISQRQCFNCDGDHKLNDCPKRRDLARISMKRKQFLGMRNESRYHEEQTKEKQYQHLAPGKISKKLREALSMLDHDLPPFIYRMRMLGYPPGWSSSSNDSGIVMYGKEGIEEQRSERNHLDPYKYVHFPGFNVPVPRACKDLANEVHLPVMRKGYQLDVHSEDDPCLSLNENCKRELSVKDYNSPYHENKRARTSSENDMDVDDVAPGTSSVIETVQSSNASSPGNTPVTRLADLEDGEIADSPETEVNLTDQPSWWLKEPLGVRFKNDKEEFAPPPFPLRPLPLHKISQILPGELNHISFEDRSRWLDPIFGNLQVRTGRYDKLKTILSVRENKRKSF